MTILLNILLILCVIAYVNNQIDKFTINLLSEMDLVKNDYKIKLTMINVSLKKLNDELLKMRGNK